MKRTILSIAVSSLLLAQPAWGGRLDACAGDCDRDGIVSLAELVQVVNIALGRLDAKACRPADTDETGTVSIEEVVLAVTSSITLCGSIPLPTPTPTPSSTSSPTPTTSSTAKPTASPTPEPTVEVVVECREPGPNGLQPCREGLPVGVSRCELDATDCLDRPEVFTIDIGAIGADGSVSLEIDPSTFRESAAVLTVQLEEDIYYRTVVLDFGLIAGVRARTVGPVPEPIVIDPSSEGTAEAVEFVGLSNVSSDLYGELLGAVNRESGNGRLYAQQSAADAKLVGVEVAFQTFFVQPGITQLASDERNIYSATIGGRTLTVFDTDNLRPLQVLGPTSGADEIVRLYDTALAQECLYVADNGFIDAGSLHVFFRQSSGRLTYSGALRFGEGVLSELARPTAVAVSDDERQLYVAAASAESGSVLLVFDRTNTSLTLIQAEPLGPGFGYRIIPDESNVYVLADDGDLTNSVVVLTRDAVNGRVTLLQRASAGSLGVENPFDFVLADNRRFAYVIGNAFLDNGIGVARRSEKDGRLTSSTFVGTGTFTVTAAQLVGDRLFVAGDVPRGEIFATFFPSALAAFEVDDKSGVPFLEAGPVAFIDHEVELDQDFEAFGNLPDVVVTRQGRIFLTSPIEEAIVEYSLEGAGELTAKSVARAERRVLPTAPENDECKTAEVITGFPASPFRALLDTTAATINENDPDSGCAFVQGHTVWYRFTAPQSGILSVSTLGGNYDTVVTVFEGGCDELSEVACNNGSEQFNAAALLVPVTQGKEYSVMIGNFGLRPAGSLVVEMALQGDRLCSACIAAEDDCPDQLACLECSFSCTGGTSRCVVPEVTTPCDDGIF